MSIIKRGWVLGNPFEFSLGILLPAMIIVVTMFYDLISGIRVPRTVHKTFIRPFSPFQNFLTLDDLQDPLGVTIPHSISKNRILFALTQVEFAGWLGYLVYVVILHDNGSVAQSLILSVAWGYASLRIILKPPLSPPYLLIFFGCSHIICGSIDLALQAMTNATFSSPVLVFLYILVPSVFVWVGGTLPLQPVQPAQNIAHSNDMPSVSLSNPEDGVTLWSWSTFSFVEPIFHLAVKRTLNDQDVWSLSPFFRHKNIFVKCLQYRSLHPKHSLLRFLVVSNSKDLIIDCVLELWSGVVGFVPPYALKRILSALADETSESKNDAYYWSLITFLAHLSFAQVDLFQNWYTRRCYERTRGQLFCSLHYKSLKRQDISGRINHEDDSRSGADLGKIVNLMQGDAYVVAQRFWEISGFFVNPVRLCIALIFLYQILGWSALSGVVVVLVAAIFNYPLAKYNISITRFSWKAKDRRMNNVNELLQNIRFLKFYGWENHWAHKVQNSREKELKWRVKENIVSTLISFIWVWMPSATALLSFLCYTLIAGDRLTVSKAFTSIALFSQLQEPMTALPGQFFAMIHGYVSMQRIEEFLSEGEVPDWASTLTKPTPHGDIPPKSETSFKAASFEWHGVPESSSAARFQLGPLDIVFPPGKLTLVSGSTGSGKSALLAALLGELQCIAGNVSLDKMNHQVAYCAQNPWLEHATIRDNIIFGSNFGYDETRYNAVVEGCALIRDFEIFEAGDLTEIGEKGITLSGGQRARIALARAMYSQATVILLDDPLAAVDMHTAQHLVTHCLSGNLARNRTIILVTHHITLCLPLASHLIELAHGKVLRQGSIQELEDLGIMDKVVEAEEDLRFQEPSVQTPENEADFLAKESISKSKKINSGKLIEAEGRAEGRVSLRTYMTYIRAAGLISWILTVLLMLFIRFINIGNQVYLARWGEAYEAGHPSSLINYIPSTLASYGWEHLPSPDVDVKPWLLIYMYISLAGACTVLLYIALGYYASLQASRSLFISLLRRLTRAPARFFDTTPIGRILNRFTTDINTVDGALQNSSRAALSGVLDFVASFCVIMVVIPTFAPFALFIAWLYIRLAPSYIQASRDLRRLESVSLSPAFAGFDELLRGLAHVRAFGMEAKYQDRFYSRVDKFQSFDHVYWLVSGWLRWRYDCLGSVVVFLTTIFALWKGVKDGSAAIVIVQAGIFAEASRQLVKVAAQLELDFNSVERIVEYLDVPQEAPAIIEKNRPPAYWPSSDGDMVVRDLVIKYAANLPAVLRNISFTVKASEKIGVVGRTGSGKSTLALSLLRMVEPTSGSIIIDGIDISTIGLEDLRTRITIVSQDVSLFSGTIRSNLDPFEEHTDQECWDVLERCHLTSLFSHPSNNRELTLDMEISQGGSLSAGERQLVALCRAILRRTNVIVMDEATSQIDSRLDDQIQKTIREEFSNAVVVTIAHRLKTIIDYDRILVLDDGEILEFGPPKFLLEKPGGAFREMCRRSVDWSLLSAAVKEGR